MALNTLHSIPQNEQPFFVGHMLLKARLLHHVDDMAGAIQQLQILLRDHGFHAEAAGLLSLIMFESGENVSTALDFADKALHDNPLLIEALLARISLNLEVGNYIQAESDAITATQHHPEVGRVWASLAQVYFNNLQFDLCKNAGEKAVHYMTDHIGTWHLLGWSHIMLGDYDSALKIFKDSYELDHRFAETHGGLAAAYAHLKQIHVAEKHIKLAQKLNPEGFAAIYAQMVLLNNDNNSNAAQALFEQAIHKSNTQIGTTPKSLIDRRLFELSGNMSNKENVH
jgi:tetratricopeptide (TPR) repeat protein